jgi:hypothetical protein
MVMRKLAGALTLTVLAVGCADSTGPADDFDATDAAFVALDTDAAAGAMVFDRIGIAPGVRPPRGVEGEFSGSRDCPAGGSISLAGNAQRTENDQGIVSWTVTAAGTWDQCAHSRSRGDRAVTTTIDGSFQYSASRMHDGAAPVGDQTTTKSGSFTWERTRGDETRSGECSYDVTSVRNAEARQIRVTGTVCGREVDRTIEWRRGG